MNRAWSEDERPGAGSGPLLTAHKTVMQLTWSRPWGFPCPPRLPSDGASVRLPQRTGV